MNLVTIPKKQYRRFVTEHKELRAEVNKLRSLVEKIASDEINENISRRLEKRSRNIDRGKGLRFNSLRTMQKYLRNL